MPARYPSYAVPPTHGLFLLHQPLVGLPSMTPRVHVGVCLYRRCGRAAHATVYDMLPVHATRASVLLGMLAGRCVPAQTRVRAVRWPVPARCDARVTFVADVVADETRVGRWVRAYTGCSCPEGEKGMELYGDNCWRFAHALVRKIRSGELAGGK